MMTDDPCIHGNIWYKCDTCELMDKIEDDQTTIEKDQFEEREAMKIVIQTRPQDWEETARHILWPELKEKQ